MKTIDETVQDLYAAISFVKGETPNYGLLKDLFIPDAKLINNNGDQPLIFNIDSFIDSLKENLANKVFESIFEIEIAYKTDLFGKIAHRFSTYEFRFNPNDENPYTIGINSIQLIQVGNQWKVTSIAWNDQRPGLEIPENYLLM